MRVPDWWPEFLTLRPRSDYQSQDNPLQLDRLPDTSRVELDLPTRRHSPQEHRAYLRRFFWLLSLIGVGIGLQETNFSTRLAPDIVENWIFIGALAVFLYYDATISKRFWIIVPLLLLYLFAVLYLVQERYSIFNKPFLFFVATLCAVRLAERICHFSLYLLTTAPTSKESAGRQRRAWRWRYFSPFLRAPYGLDFYGVGLLIALTPALLYYIIQPSNSLLPGAVIITFTFSVVLLAPIVLEFVGSYFAGRPAISVSRMWRGTWFCLGEWFTYDRHDSKSAGVFKSPLGKHKQRWRMALAVALMLIVSMAKYTSWWRAHFERWDAQAKTRAEAAGVQHEPARFFVKIRDVKLDLTSQVNLPASESDFVHDGEHHYFTTLETTQQAVTRDGHSFSWALPPELLEQEAEKSRRFQQGLRDQFGGGEPTGSFVEDKKQQDRGQENQWRWNLHSKIVWFYPVAATALVPGWLFLAYVFAVAGRFAGVRLRESKPGDPPELATAADWQQIVERIRRSNDPDEARSVLVGVNAFDHSPVLVPADVFREHAHFLGDSGSGKTALGIAPLLTQLIRFEKYSVVVVDLKADEMSLFYAAKDEAERIDAKWREEERNPGAAQREFPFRWFTTEIGKCTHAFNPLRQSAFRNLSLGQKTDLLTAALGVQYGTDYGRSYFSDANSELVRITLEAYPDVSTFRELALGMKEQSKTLPRKLQDAASHVQNIVNRLADTEALNVAVGEGEGTRGEHALHDHAIDFVDLFQRPQAAYFYLPSALGTTSNAEIARLALYSLLTAAKHAAAIAQSNGSPGERTQVFLFIDEFQRIVSHNLELFLQQARSMDIGVILANQTLADLETAGTNLIPSVRANCRFKQYFSVTDPRELEDLSRAGGDMVYLNPSLTQSFQGYFGMESGYSVTTSEQSRQRLISNDILLAGDHKHHSIVQIRRGDGYAQFGGMPFVLYSQFHIDKKTYDERRLAHWPPPSDGTLVPTSQSSRSKPPENRPKNQPALFDEPAPPPATSAYDNAREQDASVEQKKHPLDVLAEQTRSRAKTPQSHPEVGQAEESASEHPLDRFAKTKREKWQAKERLDSPQEESTEETNDAQ